MLQEKLFDEFSDEPQYNPHEPHFHSKPHEARGATHLSTETKYIETKFFTVELYLTPTIALFSGIMIGAVALIHVMDHHVVPKLDKWCAEHPEGAVCGQWCAEHPESNTAFCDQWCDKHPGAPYR